MSSYYVAIDRFGNYDLSHYGIKGQRWGVRRYQNADGSLTPEGRKRARQEYKEDNRKAFELGRKATITERALERSDRRLDKHPTNEIEIEAHKRIKEAHTKNVQEMKSHYDELVKKYGKEAIKDIAYDKNGRLKERVVTGKEVAFSVLASLASAGIFAVAGSPVSILFYPSTSKSRGNEYYRNTVANVRKERSNIKHI